MMGAFKNRVFAALLFACLFSCLPAGALDLTPERAADLALADARENSGASSDLRLFLGRVDQFPGFYRLELLSREADQKTPGTPFALYEIQSVDGRVVRRDFFAGPSRNAVSLALAESGRTGGGISIHGVLRNVPGYILQSSGYISQFRIWAEAQGRVIATETQLIDTMVYSLSGIPVTAGTVTVKAKIRGYDLTTLHPGVVLNPAQPAGIIAGVDVDFHTITPLLRDVRIIVQTNGSTDDPSFPSGARARVFIQELGKSVDVVSSNGWAEAVISGVPTGWPLRIIAINLDAGNHFAELAPLIIPEDGGTMYTTRIMLQ